MRRSVICGFLLMVGFVVCGCDSGPTKATAEQAKAFKGGPMPDSAKQRMAEGLANANQGAADAAAKARAKAQGGG